MKQFFGWRIQANTPSSNYCFFESGNISGAFNGNNKPAARSISLVIKVADRPRIRNNGGSITQDRSAIGEADPGYDAYFLDPNGNEMGIYSDK